MSAASTIATGSTFVVDVAYEGVPVLVDSPAWRTGVGWVDAGSYSYVVSEPSGAHGFYPVNDHPSDKATYRFEVTAPSDDQVIANGLLTSKTDSGDGTTTWVYEPRDPMASYLVTIAIGDFHLTESTTASGLVLRDALMPSFASMGDTLAVMHTEMIDLFEGLFGPFPFEAYGALVVNDDFGGALETQTLSAFSGSIMTGSIVEDVVAHELAHQWFGDAVTPERWTDIWLNEGFATYSEWLWKEGSRPGFDIDEHTSSLASRGRDYWAPPGDPGPSDLFASTVYIRGGLTLHALRRAVGDDAFFDILRTYVSRNLHGTVSTDDFIAVSEEVSGMQLDDLFNAWLYEGQTPELP
ncbi:MAG: M1 family metallopeptidase [Actinomycetia bacterium]|nr:M1 family metallopeptidase [Actinomycetes bacterium]